MSEHENEQLVPETTVAPEMEPTPSAPAAPPAPPRLPAGHATDFGYPPWSSAQEAGMTLVRHFTGAEKQELPCLLHCAWVVQGFAQSALLPHEGDPRPPVGDGKKKAKGRSLPQTPRAKEKVVAETFQAVFGGGEGRPFSADVAAEDPKGAIPWALVLELAEFLIEYFRKKL